jgi:hypothetical protein
MTLSTKIKKITQKIKPKSAFYFMGLLLLFVLIAPAVAADFYQHEIKDDSMVQPLEKSELEKMPWDSWVRDGFWMVTLSTLIQDNSSHSQAQTDMFLISPITDDETPVLKSNTLIYVSKEFDGIMICVGNDGSKQHFATIDFDPKMLETPFLVTAIGTSDNWDLQGGYATHKGIHDTIEGKAEVVYYHDEKYQTIDNRVIYWCTHDMKPEHIYVVKLDELE